MEYVQKSWFFLFNKITLPTVNMTSTVSSEFNQINSGAEPAPRINARAGVASVTAALKVLLLN